MVNLMIAGSLQFYDHFRKKMGPDLSNTNYTLVSNWKSISKLVEKCVFMQLEDNLTLNGLHADHQSAYKGTQL